MLRIEINFHSAYSGVWDEKSKTPSRKEKGYHLWGILFRLMGERLRLSQLVDEFSAFPQEHPIQQVQLPRFLETLSSNSNELVRPEKAYYSKSNEVSLQYKDTEKKPAYDVIEKYKPFNLLCASDEVIQQILLETEKTYPTVYRLLQKDEDLCGVHDQNVEIDIGDKVELWFQFIEEFLSKQDAILWDVKILESLNEKFHDLEEGNLQIMRFRFNLFMLYLGIVRQQGFLDSKMGTMAGGALFKYLQKIEGYPNDKKKDLGIGDLRKGVSFLNSRDFTLGLYKVTPKTQLKAAPAKILKKDGRLCFWIESSHPDLEKRVEHEEFIYDRIQDSGVHCFRYGKKGLAYVEQVRLLMNDADYNIANEFEYNHISKLDFSEK
ncbi:MAG: hypothetical protein ACI86H_001272 [bacterium]|jgi:hypothetical protein